MQDLWGFCQNLLGQIGDYSSLIFLLSSCAIVILTQAVKIPIKKLTSKISDNVKRQKVNLIIMIIPFGFGILINYLVSLLPYYNFEWQVGMAEGYLAEFIYCFLEKLLAKVEKGEVVNDCVVSEATKEAKKETDSKEKSFKNLIDSIKF